jgi:hypothetical protein
MRSLVVLVLAAGCGHKAADTSEWCLKYINHVRARGTADVKAMTAADDRQTGANGLLGMVGSDPALEVAFDACSDADGDLGDVIDKRRIAVVEAQKRIASYVTSHASAPLDDSQAKELVHLVEALTTAYTDPALAAEH